jgi:hypothetical protein
MPHVAISFYILRKYVFSLPNESIHLRGCIGDLRQQGEGEDYNLEVVACWAWLVSMNAQKKMKKNKKKLNQTLSPRINLLR